MNALLQMCLKETEEEEARGDADSVMRAPFSVLLRVQ